MAWSGDLYSRVVTWMKIILPLAALALLSTLFLIQRKVDPTAQPPITQTDLEQRAQEQGVTNPSFSGVTSGGDEVIFKARRARPDLSDPERMIADDVMAKIRLTEGTIIDIAAEHADMNQGNATASMEGNVHVETTSGYLITTERLTARYDILFAETPGPVQATGPIGELTAGKMRLSSSDATGEAELLFTDGVKLIYNRNVSKD